MSWRPPLTDMTMNFNRDPAQNWLVDTTPQLNEMSISGPSLRLGPFGAPSALPSLPSLPPSPHEHPNLSGWWSVP